MTFEIRGVDDTKKILGELMPKTARNLNRATVHGVASVIAKKARAKAPKKTGTLKKAIKAKRQKSKPENPISAVVVEHGNDVKNDAFYWRFLEYGTRTGIKEHGFIRSAFEEVLQNFEKIYTEQFGKKLESAAKRARKKLEK